VLAIFVFSVAVVHAERLTHRATPRLRLEGRRSGAYD
jgi:hypothetical protein